MMVLQFRDSFNSNFIEVSNQHYPFFKFNAIHALNDFEEMLITSMNYFDLAATLYFHSFLQFLMITDYCFLSIWNY